MYKVIVYIIVFPLTLLGKVIVVASAVESVINALGLTVHK